MANVDIDKALSVANAVEAALHVEAQKPTNSLQQQDVKDVAPAVTAAVQAKVDQTVKPAIEAITNQEPFYLSIQWWTQMLGLLVAIAGIFGIVIPAEMQKEILAIIAAVIGLTTAGLMFYNRYIRSNQLLITLGIRKP